MGDFTAKSALLTGVDLIRRRPRLFLLWIALSLALTLVFAVSYQEFMAWVRGRAFAAGPITSINGLLLAYALAKALVSLVLTSVLWASAYRAILRPAARSDLGFGPEELCVFGAWFIPQLVVAVVSAFVPVVLISRLAVPSIALIRNTSVAISVLGLFWSAVASVWAFEKLRVAPLRCWTIARGRFWLLAVLVIGVAVLQHLGSLGAQQLARVVAFHLPPIFAHPPLATALEPGPDLGSLFEAPALLREVLGAVIQALEIAFVGGIVASAYRASQSDPQAASFSAGSVAEPS